MNREKRIKVGMRGIELGLLSGNSLDNSTGVG
jgi:hypothetical protein